MLKWRLVSKLRKCIDSFHFISYLRDIADAANNEIVFSQTSNPHE